MTNPLLHTLLSALALPSSSRLDKRVPKKFLIEHGANTAADRRLLTGAVESLHWIAVLKPETVAVPAYSDEQREYTEVIVIGVDLRPEHAPPARQRRVVELVHRAIPYPLLVLASTGERVTLSAAHKRRALNEDRKFVLDGDVLEAAFDPDQPPNADLQHALALNRQPAAHMLACYQGWMDCLTAARVQQLIGCFRLAETPAVAVARRDALRDCERMAAEEARLRTLAAKERQMAKRVDINLALQRVQTDLAAARAKL